jgi:hypothetical protein
MKEPYSGLIFIEEQTSPDDYKIKNFHVENENGIFYTEFDACLHSFDVMNRNSRMYEASNIDKCLHTERILSYLAHGGWYGEMNHPTPKYKDKPLSSERIQDIDMHNTSHRMLNPHIENNLLVSKVQTDAGTDSGMNLAKKMVQGFIPSFSCRAIATLVLKSGKPVVDVRKIITYDWVLYPSHKEADQLTSTPTKFVNKSTNCVQENTSEDILIPLKEILENVGRTDVNAQAIMEAFDLTNDDLVGFTPDKKNMIMKDNNNMIYCNINQESRKKVNEYLRSF